MLPSTMDASAKSKRLQLQPSAQKKPLPLRHAIPSARLSLPTAPTNEVLSFLAKVAALEAARRISTARCPVLWNAVQALQLLTYPPFKWAQRWTPLRILIKGIQNISKPLLLISVTTAIVDHSKHADRPTETTDNITSTSASSIHLETEGSEGTTEGTFSENWLVQLFKELEKQCITLPERFDKCELERFYSAANGDLSVLLSSLKKTIRWRETYHIFSVEELEKWSHLVFWHGCDVMSRPCLVIRFGFACSHLDPKDRPGFAQAVVSQIEHGIMHLVKEEEPTISVLMDCKGVSPFRFPMQMLRAVTNLVQDNYPNRLGRLLIVRLPPLVRVIAQTFMQVLKPATRQKMQLEGEGYHKAISELLQIVPAFVGGDCKCAQCHKIAGKVDSKIEEICRSSSSKMQRNEKELEVELEEIMDIPLAEMESGAMMCNHVLRCVVVGFLLLWIAIAFMASINEPMSM